MPLDHNEVMITTVTGKNQITISTVLARQLNIQSGQRIDWTISAHGELIARLLARREELAHQAAGMGRKWLEVGVDLVVDLIDERVRGDESG